MLREVFAIFFSFALAGSAAEIELRPVADTTLFQPQPTHNMGAHSHVAIGVTALGTGARGLFRFDLSSLPTNAVVESVTMTFDLPAIPRGDSGGSQYAVYRMLKSWGEGTKSGNTGLLATTGEATWNHSALPTTWAAAGGAAGTDYAADASATQVLGPAPGVFSFDSTTGFVADVQRWIASPDENFGWMVKVVDETTTLTARRFSSRETASAPILRVEYSVTAAPEIRFTSIERIGTNVMMRWTGSQGQVFVESAGELPPQWQTVGSALNGEFTDALTTTKRFYRLRQ